MRIKTYTSDSVAKALAQIRKELGPDAVVLSTRRSVRKRFLGLLPRLAYEITAASDGNAQKNAVPAALPSSDATGKPAAKEQRTPSGGGNEHSIETYEVATTPLRSPSSRTSRRRVKSATRETAPSVRPPRKHRQAPGLRRLEAEIEEIKEILKRQSGTPWPGWMFLGNQQLSRQFERLVWSDGQLGLDWGRAQAVSRELVRLLRQGVEENLALLLLRNASHGLPREEDSGQRVRLRLQKAILDMVQVSCLAAAPAAPKMAVFLGPTGVGKTTTIAKLAALLTLQKGHKVHLITLDTYRIAAAEQLKTFGEIIGIRVKVAFSIDELDEMVSAVGEQDWVLIDTTGHSHKKVSEFQDLAAYLGATEKIEKHLVLSCTTRAEEMREAVNSFEVFSPDRLVFTKLDESSGFGTIFSELVRTGKPLSFLTNGQRVPEDLIIPTSQQVADLVVPIN